MKWYRRPYSAIIQRCRDFMILQFEKFCYGNTIISLQPFPWQWRGGNKRTREWSLVFDFLLMKKHYLAINRSFTFNPINWARFIPFVLIFIEIKRKTYSILNYNLFLIDWSFRWSANLELNIYEQLHYINLDVLTLLLYIVLLTPLSQGHFFAIIKSIFIYNKTNEKCFRWCWPW